MAAQPARRVRLGQDHGLWHRWWDGNAWVAGSPWAESSHDATVVSWAESLDIFGRAPTTPSAPLVDGNAWGGWESLAISHVEVAPSLGPEPDRLFAIGTDNAVCTDGGTATSGRWESLGGSLMSGNRVSWGRTASTFRSRTDHGCAQMVGRQPVGAGSPSADILTSAPKGSAGARTDRHCRTARTRRSAPMVGRRQWGGWESLAVPAWTLATRCPGRSRTGPVRGRDRQRGLAQALAVAIGEDKVFRRTTDCPPRWLPVALVPDRAVVPTTNRSSS